MNFAIFPASPLNIGSLATSTLGPALYVFIIPSPPVAANRPEFMPVLLPTAATTTK